MQLYTRMSLLCPMQQIVSSNTNHLWRKLRKESLPEACTRKKLCSWREEYLAHKKGPFCTQVCLDMLCARKGRCSFVCVIFLFFLHFYKYDVSYKMLRHLKVHSILFFKYRKNCHHNKILKHITSVLVRGLHHIPMVSCHNRSWQKGWWGSGSMTQAQREETDHEDKRRRHCDTVVTEGNGNTE